jgi:hypothetical protein
MNHLDVKAYHDNENFAILISLTERKNLEIYEVITVKEKCKPMKSDKDVYIMFIFVGNKHKVVPRRKFNSINVDGTIVYFDKLRNGDINSTQTPTGIFVIEESDCWEILAKIPKGKLKTFVREHIECFSTTDDTLQVKQKLHEFVKEYLVSNGCKLKPATPPPQAVGNGGVLKPG